MKFIKIFCLNRYLKKAECNAFIRHVSITEAYQKFPSKDSLSFSTFYKYIDDKFKKPARLTDLCDYCEFGKELKRELIDLAVTFEYDNLDQYQDLDTHQMRIYFQNYKQVFTGNQEDIDQGLITINNCSCNLFSYHLILQF